VVRAADEGLVDDDGVAPALEAPVAAAPAAPEAPPADGADEALGEAAAAGSDPVGVVVDREPAGRAFEGWLPGRWRRRFALVTSLPRCLGSCG
jgi:hypothetical protein